MMNAKFTSIVFALNVYPLDCVHFPRTQRIFEISLRLIAIVSKENLNVESLLTLHCHEDFLLQCLSVYCFLYKSVGGSLLSHASCLSTVFGVLVIFGLWMNVDDCC